MDRRRFVRRLLKVPPRLVYAAGLGRLMGKVVLLLTTTGRRTGLPRITPLQYEEIDGTFQVGAMDGLKADWVRNILAEPRVIVRVGSRMVPATAEVTTDPRQIADFVEYRLTRRPRLVGSILRAEGLDVPIDREQLEDYTDGLALVTLRPIVVGAPGGAPVTSGRGRPARR